MTRLAFSSAQFQTGGQARKVTCKARDLSKLMKLAAEPETKPGSPEFHANALDVAWGNFKSLSGYNSSWDSNIP